MNALNTVALELAPPERTAAADDVARAVGERCRRHGLLDRLGHVLLPGIVAEEERPVPLTPRLDVLDFWKALRPVAGSVSGLCTQVTVFETEAALAERVRNLSDAGMDGIIFVGKPHGLPTADAPGPTPQQALIQFRDETAHRGVVLIPTRHGELDRFAAKCAHGATFALTQLLYSERIVAFLRAFAARTEHRPEILLSFGFVPGVETRVGLIDWLLHDDGNDEVAREQAFVARLAASPPEPRRDALVDLYRRVLDGVGDLGFPLSLHLESPYGLSDSACETFAALLDHWSPRQEVRS
ncbi:mycobacterial-type methylenetetrahydrofolate reductase [Rhodococcus hoagii]|nr:mycobacterial-type methylenetetrahydrofolate reductase [Prescottella equi]